MDRTNVVLERKKSSRTREKVWYGVRLVFLFVIMISIMTGKYWYLTCSPVVYRKSHSTVFTYLLAYNFLLIFLLDAISSVVDMVKMIFFMPSSLNKRKRIKMIRKQARANMTKEKATIHDEQANNKKENKLAKSEQILPSKLREIDTD